MKSRIAEILTLACGILPCGTGWSGQANRDENVHYYRMKVVRIMDRQGFDQPVEVARLLIPTDWRAEGGADWTAQIGCPANIVQVRFRATAPDGVTGIELTPSYVWHSATDPMAAQMIRENAAAGSGCEFGPVLGAVDYIRQRARRLRPGARVVAVEPLPAVAQASQALLAYTYQPLVQAGAVRGYRVDSARVRLEYASAGQTIDEWISSSVTTVAIPDANLAALAQGQMNMDATRFMIVGDQLFSAKASKGRMDDKLMATIITSIRSNPQYTAAIGQFLNNMSNIAMQGAMDRQKIWRDAGQQISATISQTYRDQQNVQDRAAANFSQYVRGVEIYQNPATGERVELTSGYTSAWANNRNEYLLSDTPNFDPNVVLRENWTQLNRSR